MAKANLKLDWNEEHYPIYGSDPRYPGAKYQQGDDCYGNDGKLIVEHAVKMIVDNSGQQVMVTDFGKDDPRTQHGIKPADESEAMAEMREQMEAMKAEMAEMAQAKVDAEAQLAEARGQATSAAAKKEAAKRKADAAKG